MRLPAKSAFAAIGTRQAAAYLTIVAIWGSTWAAIRIAVYQLPPMRVAAIRFVTAGLLMLLVARLRGIPLPRGRVLQAAVWIGLGMIGVQYAMVFSAARYISSGLTAILYAALPVVIGVLTPRLLGRRVPRAAYFAMLIAMGGLVTILSGVLSTSPSQFVPALTMLAAVVIAAVGSIYIRRELRQVSAIAVAAIQFISGGLLLGVLSLVLERHLTAVWVHQEVLALLFLIFAGSMVAFTLFYWLLQNAEPYRVATLQYLVPLMAVTEGAVLLRERIPLLWLAGGAAVLLSTVLILRVPPDDDDYLSLTPGNRSGPEAETVGE